MSTVCVCVKEFVKLVNIWRKYGQKLIGAFLWPMVAYAVGCFGCKELDRNENKKKT